MPSDDVLEAAGRRAAFRPVPTPPSIDSLAKEVDRRRTKRRRVVGGVAAAAIAVIAIPLAVVLIDDGQPDVVTLGSDPDTEAVSAEPSSLATQTELSPTPAAPPPSTTASDESRGRIRLLA